MCPARITEERERVAAQEMWPLAHETIRQNRPTNSSVIRIRPFLRVGDEGQIAFVVNSCGCTLCKISEDDENEKRDEKRGRLSLRKIIEAWPDMTDAGRQTVSAIVRADARHFLDE